MAATIMPVTITPATIMLVTIMPATIMLATITPATIMLAISKTVPPRHRHQVQTFGRRQQKVLLPPGKPSTAQQLTLPGV